MSRTDCDLVIIGSGFGGAVCALRAAQAGMSVIVLERGQRMTDAAYEELAGGRLPAFHSRKAPGLIEIHKSGGLLGFSGSAVGGTSHLYTAVTLPAPPEIFAGGWPSGISAETLRPYYDRVAEVISPSPVPQALSRTIALEQIGRRLGARVTRLPLAMTWPQDLGKLHRQPSPDGVYAELATWLRGGRTGRKRTLAQTYLASAELLGASVRPLHEVQAIIPTNGLYRIEYRAFEDDQWHDGALAAPRAVIAAGTLGTNRLLLHCRDVLKSLPNLGQALGQRFFTNGDFGALLLEPKEPPTLDGGPPVTAWIDLWDRHRLFIMETGLIPYDTGSLAGLLNPAKWLAGMRLTPAKRCTWSFGVMGFDDNPGTLRLNRRGKMVHRHDSQGGEDFRRRTYAVLGELAEAASARLLAPPLIVARRLPVTVHPLGGAAMAESPDQGVTDPFGEVFGYAGLHVADGSLACAPTGVPPSMTIAALAERVIENMIGQC